MTDTWRGPIYLAISRNMRAGGAGVHEGDGLSSCSWIVVPVVYQVVFEPYTLACRQERLRGCAE